MPEGPEIHRAADRLRKALVGKKLSRCTPTSRHTGRLDGWVGREVESVDARGAMLIRVGDHVLYSHNQLYGQWTVNRATTAPLIEPGASRSFRRETHACRLWSASDVVLLEAWEVEGHPYIAQLGPDVADLRTTVAEVRVRLERFQRLGSRAAARSALPRRRGQLPAQRDPVRSGLGPVTTGGPVEQAEKARWPRRGGHPHRAYHQKGVTVDMATFQTMRDNGVARRGARHYVFHRDGMACRCQSTIVHGRVGGRYWTSVPPAKPDLHHGGLQAFDNTIKIRVMRDLRNNVSRFHHCKQLRHSLTFLVRLNVFQRIKQFIGMWRKSYPRLPVLKCWMECHSATDSSPPSIRDLTWAK